MATNAQLLSILEKIQNGEGIQGIRSDIKILKEKVVALSEDVKEIKDEGFHDDESLKSRLVLLEKSVENIKQYEIIPIKDKLTGYFDQKANNRNTLYIRVIGAVLGAIALYILAQVFGISA